MQKIGILALALLCFAASATAQSRWVPADANVRFSEQISNGPAGACGCFAMEGVGADVAWHLRQLGNEHKQSLGAVADISAEHTGQVANAPYGLTLTTLDFGPRYAAPAFKSTTLFAQTLFGFSHGSDSEFPQNNSLVPSATSFAFNLGGGADYAVRPHLALRVLQVEYLRTALPNNSSDWQNNLRLSAGLTFRFGK